MKWLLLRGLGREVRHWGRFPEIMSSQTGVEGIVALDLPGCGEHCNLTSPLRISEFVDFLRVEFLRLNTGGPWGVIGISMGGMIAADWTATYGDFDRCVMINSSSSGAVPVSKRLQIGTWRRIAVLLRQANPADREKIILGLTVNRQTVIDENLSRWESFARNSPCSRVNMLRQILAASRFLPRQIRQKKVLVVRSLGDRLVHPACSEKLKDFFSATMISHPSAGHDLPLEEPDWLVNSILAWQSME